MVDYTECNKTVDETFQDTGMTCASEIAKNKSAQCICNIKFTLPTDFKGKVYMYYGLSNYYQNHRRYVKSRDDSQLLGKLDPFPSSDCNPFAFHLKEGVEKPVAPCGAIANSMFNDTLVLINSKTGKPVPLLRTGIAWPSDKNIKFRNPSDPEGCTSNCLKMAFQNYSQPRNWQKPIWELDPDDKDNNGFQNEDFIVWMRTAALPTFRKLYRRINHDIETYRDGLGKGEYELRVHYSE